MVLWLVVFLCLVMLFFANMMILSNQPVKSVLSLMGCFLCVSVMWLLLGAEFLALVLIFVYVGAVMTLFLFMVMMLNISRYDAKSSLSVYVSLPVVLLITVVPILLFVYFNLNQWKASYFDAFFSQDWGFSSGHMLTFSQALYHDYFWPLQMLALILVIPVVVATGLVRKGHPSSVRVQQSRKQLGVDASNRLTLVSKKMRKR